MLCQGCKPTYGAGAAATATAASCTASSMQRRRAGEKSYGMLRMICAALLRRVPSAGARSSAATRSNIPSLNAGK